MALPQIDPAKTFVIIAGAGGDVLGRGVAVSLLEDKRLLHEKFNGTKMPPWQSVTNHLGPDATRDEIHASLDHVLNGSNRFMMILSGYQDNDEWNGALKDFMRTNNLSATFLNVEGDTPPADVRRLFHAYSDIPEEVETGDPVDWARTIIRQARTASAVPVAVYESMKLHGPH